MEDLAATARYEKELKSAPFTMIAENRRERTEYLIFLWSDENEQLARDMCADMERLRDNQNSFAHLTKDLSARGVINKYETGAFVPSTVRCGELPSSLDQLVMAYIYSGYYVDDPDYLVKAAKKLRRGMIIEGWTNISAVADWDTAGPERSAHGAKRKRGNNS